MHGGPGLFLCLRLILLDYSCRLCVSGDVFFQVVGSVSGVGGVISVLGLARFYKLHITSTFSF